MRSLCDFFVSTISTFHKTTKTKFCNGSLSLTMSVVKTLRLDLKSSPRCLLSLEEGIVFGTDEGTLHFFNDQTHIWSVVGAGPIVSVLKLEGNRYLMLVDDNRGSNGYAAVMVKRSDSDWTVLPQTFPRMNSVQYSKSMGLVYTLGRTVTSVPNEKWGNPFMKESPLWNITNLPSPGVRTGPFSLLLLEECAVCAVGNAFWRVSANESPQKIVSFSQSSQVHPMICLANKDVMCCASGREFGVYQNFQLLHGICTCASPILALELNELLVLLTSDGLVSVRSPACPLIALRTVEVGTQPNDYFALSRGYCLAYSAKLQLLEYPRDSRQDLADRLIRLAIDGLGNFARESWRQDVARSIHASFTAASHVGSEPTVRAKKLLHEYLQALLRETNAWPTLECTNSYRLVQETPSLLVTVTALMCAVASQLNITGSSLLAKACAEKVGLSERTKVDESTCRVVELVVSELLKQPSSSISLTSTTMSAAATGNISANKVVVNHLEAAVWLLRCINEHERSIQVAHDRLRKTYWSLIKYDSYAALHLSDLWSSGGPHCELVLSLDITRRLLEQNAPLGLSVFTAPHPQNTSRWKQYGAVTTYNEWNVRVVKLCQSSCPMISHGNRSSSGNEEYDALPLHSGRALAATFLESALGVYTGRIEVKDNEAESSFHDELACLLLEGVIAERGDDQEHDNDSPLGKCYRQHLKRFLQWPLCRIHATQFLQALPASFRPEQALVLGKLGRHDDALDILYTQCQDMDLCLEYCDELQKQTGDDNSFLPLIRVALNENPEKGAAVAIQILAQRRHVMDWSAALKLLPQKVLISAVARPFLIPAMVDAESEVKRLTMQSALYTSRYKRLQKELIHAQLQAQSHVQVVELGEPLHSTKPVRVRLNQANLPQVWIVKHYFPQDVVLQAKVTNTTDGTLKECLLFVAESSDEALQVTKHIPIQTLPVQATSSSWCVVHAQRRRLEGPTSLLTSEFRVNDRVVDLPDVEVQGAHFV